MRVLLPLLGVLCACGLLTAGDAEQAASADRLRTAALQISLDNEGFSPGVIDGRDGNKTSLALSLAREAGRDIVPFANPWSVWIAPADVAADIGPAPESWLGRSKLVRLSYESVIEKLAEQFHVSEGFLRFLNPQIQDWTKLDEGRELGVPALAPCRLPKADHLRVRLAEKVIVACDAQDRPLASFPCSIAAKKEKRPVGKLDVSVLAPNPDYLFDPRLFTETPEAATIKSKLMIPPGPNNPVGEMWIGLNLKGYGIHGTPAPEDIGKTESHGCFRLANWDAKRLGKIVRIGTPVFVEE